MATITWGDLLDRVARRGHKTLAVTAERDDVVEAAKEGIERVESENSWEWLRSAQTLTLAAEDYDYAWAAGIDRFDVHSFRYGGRGTNLHYLRRPENIDAELGPDWRTDTSKAGTPRYFATSGQNFWIAPMPSAAFVASYPTVYYYAWSSDLYTISQIDTTATTTAQDATSLLIPLRALSVYTHASLAALLQQEDDPDWQRFDQLAERGMAKLRGYSEAISGDSEMDLPDFAHLMDY